MKIFKQLLIILAINFIGELLSRSFSLPLPGSIVGMVLLLILLFSGVIKENQIAETANFLLDHMPFFFIPAGVSVMIAYRHLEGNLATSVITIVLSTLLVMVLTAITTQLFIKGKNNDERNNE